MEADMPMGEPTFMITDQGQAMSREDASAGLAALEAKMNPPPPINPEDAQGARARLDLLSKDPRWAHALINGDADTRRQFDALVAKVVAGDDVGDAIAGIVEPLETAIEVTYEGQLPRKDLASAVAGLRDSGLNDAAIVQAMNGGTVSLAEYKAAEATKAALTADPAWRAALLAGDFAAKRTLLLLSTVLASTIAEL
jgi:hypothetical protein